MASPISTQQLQLPPMTDPDSVKEVFCNDVVVQVRKGGVQITFNSIQASNSDAAGKVADKRVVRARVGMSAEVAQAMLTVFQQIGVAMHRHQVMAGAAAEKKPN